MKALSARHLKFVAQFLATGNGTAAYLSAGFRCARKSAGSNAARLLADPRVQALLKPSQQAEAVALAEEVRVIQISRETIRQELARVGFFDPRRLFAPDGRLKAVTELDANTAAAVAQFDVTETTDEEGVTTRITKLKFWDKMKALQLLGDTEPGVWAEDAKGKGGTSVNVQVDVNQRLISLTDADLDAVDRILSGAGVDAEAHAEGHTLAARGQIPP